MLQMLLPLIRGCSGATWITIGDGRYGSDASFLREQGVEVVATSLSDATLRAAAEKGYIGPFKSINAESITEPDGAYDFVLCKESYHHFPRPPVAFYEMLRIARRGVVLIEPAEAGRKPLDFAKDLAKKVLRGKGPCLFEPCGNYLYRFSVREIEKMITALGGTHVAYKRFNDFYLARCAHHSMEGMSCGSLITRLGIFVQDVLCALRMMDYGLATVMAFKEPLSDALRQGLRRSGFHVIDLPANPWRAGKY